MLCDRNVAMANDAEELDTASTTDETLPDLRGLSILCRGLLRRLSATDVSVDAAEARDVMASFNLWAANMGVFRNGHHSLASRLKNTPQISGLLHRLLLMLRHDLGGSIPSYTETNGF